MKYYFNFICQPNDGALGTETTADGYRFPTDPMYKQDGVYNQRCKYKITNFVISDLLQSETVRLKGRTLIVRFNSLSCMNSWTLTSFGGSNSYKQIGQNSIEFHIRMSEEMVSQTGGTPAVVQTLTSTVEQPQTFVGTSTQTATYTLVSGEIDKYTIPADNRDGSTTIPVGRVSTLTTPEVAGTSNIYNNSLINTNSFSEELIGMPCWGEQVDLSFLDYGSTEEAENLKDADATKDINICFTLEVEPIAVKL
tara:strand:- start:75 stop:830 length:756 start_codon:yes stop_codon:yes gene_type:complete